jgi:hypothetical protein
MELRENNRYTHKRDEWYKKEHLQPPKGRNDMFAIVNTECPVVPIATLMISLLISFLSDHPFKKNVPLKWRFPKAGTLLYGIRHLIDIKRFIPSR